MTKTLIIPGTLPGLNEYINAERRNKYIAANIKKRAEKDISVMIRKYLSGIKYKKPVVMDYTWYEPNQRRDKDNIVFARKFIQDALVSSGVLKNDGWKDVDGFSDSFEVDKQNPRVEVVISEV